MSELEQRLAYGIDEFCKIANLGRTTLYKDIAEGRLRAVKNGRRTVILRDEAMAFSRHFRRSSHGSDSREAALGAGRPS
jgi:excisionase family DNA binding protein